MDILDAKNRSTMTDKEKAMRKTQSRAPRPRLAATILLVRGAPGQEEILVGLRSKKHDFFPDVYVFPGGGVDRADSRVQAGDDLDPRTQMILEAALPPRRARATVMAAIRETYEETGFVIGEPTDTPPYTGSHPSWRGLAKTGLTPDLSEIHVIGRAITPPYRPKRFDAWFFMTRLTKAQSERPFADSDELLDTRWVGLEDAKALKMHAITSTMVDVLIKYLQTPTPPPDIFFSRFERGKFVMDPFPSQ